MNRKQQLFGNKLRELRIQKRLTQEQLGEAIGVTANAIGQFERGIMYPNFETLYRIILTLDIDANIIFSNQSRNSSSSAKWFGELIGNLKREERVAISNFLNQLSHIIILNDEMQCIEIIKDDEFEDSNLR